MRRRWYIVGFILIIAGIAIAWAIISHQSFSVLSPIVFEKKVREVVENRPLDAYSIDALSKRTFVGSQIILDPPIATTAAYIVYPFHFISDTKNVTGIAHVPIDASPTNKKPVIIQYRGYIDPTLYQPGDETKHSAEVYAKNGFISLAPDFLGYGGSDKQASDVFEERFQTYTTALNLYASVGSLPMANAQKIGIWGHSNGGHIALTVLEILHISIPTSLWAPVSKPFPYSILYYTDDAQDHGKQLRKLLAKFEQTYDVERYSLTNYLNRIQGPLIIHQGSVDDAVPKSWTDQLVDELKDAQPLSYFVYPGADHNMLPDAWNTVVARDVAFFEKNLVE